jgi:hypothetical protein
MSDGPLGLMVMEPRSSSSTSVKQLVAIVAIAVPVLIVGAIAISRHKSDSADQISSAGSGSRSAEARTAPERTKQEVPKVDLVPGSKQVGSVTVTSQLPGLVAEDPLPFDFHAAVVNGKTVAEASTPMNLAYYPDPPATDLSKTDNRYNITVFDGLSSDAMKGQLGAAVDHEREVQGAKGTYRVGSEQSTPDGPTWTTVVFSPHDGTVVQINGRGFSDDQLVAVADGMSR